MEIKKNSSYISYFYEERDDFYELGYRILQKENNPCLLRSVQINENGHKKVFYMCKNYEVLSEVIRTLPPAEAWEAIKQIFLFLDDLEEKDFFKKENVDIKNHQVYYNKLKKRIGLIIVPQNNSREDKQEKAAWNADFTNLIANLLQHICMDKETDRNWIIDELSKETCSFKNILKKIDNIMKSCRKTIGATGLVLAYQGVRGSFNLYIRKNHFIVGKSNEEVDGYIPISNAISRKHCLIENRNGVFCVKDLESKNHTYVNGKIVEKDEEIPLNIGDILKVADVELMVREETC